MSNDIGKYILVGKVLEVYPETFTARVEIKNSSKYEFGKFVECKIMSMRINPMGAASVTLPRPQDLVYVSTQFSQFAPMIVGYVPPSNEEPQEPEFQHQLTPGRTTGTFDPNFQIGSAYSRGIGPLDLLPGDSVQMGEEGQALGLLTGGTIIAKASALCQMILTKSRETMLLVARRLRIITDFGEITSGSEAGRAFLSIKGNTGVQQSNKRPGSYGINIRLGGKDLLNANLEKQCSIIVSADGQAQIRSKDLFLESLNSTSHFVNKALKIDVRGGEHKIIDGALPDPENPTKTYTKHLQVLGSEKHTVSSSYALNVSGTYTQVVNKAVKLTYNATANINVKGIPFEDLTNTVGYGLTVGRGDVELNIGEMALLPVPVPGLAGKLGGFKVNITAGDFAVKSLIGDIEMQTLLGLTNISSVLSSKLEATAGIAEVKGLLVKLDAELRMLNGNGSSDAVVTALRLTQQILNKVVLTFNIHQHPPIPPIVGGPVLPPLTQMQPIIPTDVCEKTTLT